MASLSTLPKTELTFQSAPHQQKYILPTRITSITPLHDLSEDDKALFRPAKSPAFPIFVLTTAATIFHPQGGGQPSDIGYFADSSGKTIFTVWTVRVSGSHPGVVLHIGHFTVSEQDHELADPATTSGVAEGTEIVQHVDAEKRILFSRLHTAGHVLGAATRTLLEDKIEGFDELKANHFPDAASCEFQGLIEGKWKGDIQKSVDELVETDAEVRIEWWTKEDFRSRGLERLLPEEKVWREIAVLVGRDGETSDGEDDNEKTKIRVVNIVGAEVYPCGGTHVPTTKGCGKVNVRKISRQKGTSRVSYLVD